MSFTDKDPNLTVRDLFHRHKYPNYQFNNLEPANAKAWIDAIHSRLVNENSIEGNGLIANSIGLLLKLHPSLIPRFIDSGIIESDYFFELLCELCDTDETEVYCQTLDKVICFNCMQRFIRGELKECP